MPDAQLDATPIRPRRPAPGPRRADQSKATRRMLV